jgi:hypothetical protein
MVRAPHPGRCVLAAAPAGPTGHALQARRVASLGGTPGSEDEQCRDERHRLVAQRHPAHRHGGRRERPPDAHDQSGGERAGSGPSAPLPGEPPHRARGQQGEERGQAGAEDSRDPPQPVARDAEPHRARQYHGPSRRIARAHPVGADLEVVTAFRGDRLRRRGVLERIRPRPQLPPVGRCRPLPSRRERQRRDHQHQGGCRQGPPAPPIGHRRQRYRTWCPSPITSRSLAARRPGIPVRGDRGGGGGEGTSLSTSGSFATSPRRRRATTARPPGRASRPGR